MKTQNEEKYLELLKKGDLNSLQQLLESTIRDNIALQTNKKSRINVIKKMQNENEKVYTRLVGYGEYYNQYVFTNSYVMAVLNDNLSYDKSNTFPDCISLIDRVKISLSETTITIKELMYSIKTKENYTNENLGNISFDWKYLKMGIDILGECEVFTAENNRMLVLKNNDEIVLIMGMGNIRIRGEIK